MQGFTLSVNKYLEPEDKMDPFMNCVAKPEKVNYGAAISDLVCHGDYWGAKAPPSESAPKSRRSFSLARLFPRLAGKAPEAKVAAAPVLCDARMIVKLEDVSCYADMCNGYDMTGLKADTAHDIASRLRGSLVSTIKAATQGDNASSLWNVSEVTSRRDGFEITVQVPQPILNQMRQSLQRSNAPKS